MAPRKIALPAANEPFILANGTINPNWYLVLKFLETLQPLSDIPTPSLPSPVTPGSTSASVTGIAKSWSTNPVGGVQTFLLYDQNAGSTFNQMNANNMTTIADALTNASANDATLAAAVAALSTRVNTLETKFNAVLSALS